MSAAVSPTCAYGRVSTSTSTRMATIDFCAGVTRPHHHLLWLNSCPASGPKTAFAPSDAVPLCTHRRA
eukprot:2380007-Pyramimonas_sp.AAC.1